jgi:hypothetical protein
MSKPSAQLPTAGIELTAEIATVDELTLPVIPVSERMRLTGAGQRGEWVGVGVLLAVCDAVTDDDEVCEAVLKKEGEPEDVLDCEAV